MNPDFAMPESSLQRGMLCQSCRVGQLEQTIAAITKRHNFTFFDFTDFTFRCSFMILLLWTSSHIIII